MSNNHISIRIDDSGVPFSVEGLDLGPIGSIVPKVDGYGASIDIPDGSAYSPIVAGKRLSGGECRYEQPFTVRFSEKIDGVPIELSIENRPDLARLHDRLAQIGEEIFEERERREEVADHARYEEFAKTLEENEVVLVEHYNHDTGAYYYTIYEDSRISNAVEEFDCFEIDVRTRKGSYWVTTSQSIQAARSARAEKARRHKQWAARKSAELAAKRDQAKAEAIRSGSPVEFRSEVDRCDGSVEECTWDRLSYRIDPSGNEIIVRMHTH